MTALPTTLARQALEALAKNRGNLSKAARSLGLNRETFRGRINAARAQKLVAPHLNVKAAPPDVSKTAKLVDKLQEQVIRLTQARKFKRAKVVKRSGKDDIVRVFMPDMHGHYHDPAAVAAFLADMKRLQPDHITNLGDFIDCGGFLAAHHVIGYMAQMEYSYEQDVTDGNGVLDQLQRDCPNTEIEMLEGNHEDRVERWCIGQALGSGKDADYLRRAFAPQFLLNLKNRGINYYRRSEMYDGLSIPGAVKRGKIIVVHDPGFSDPRRTLSRFGAPVVHGHDHQSHANVTSTVGQGDIGVWSFGCLAQRQQLYAHSRPTGHVHGYGIALQSRSGHFLMLSVPIIGGVSYLGRAFK